MSIAASLTWLRNNLFSSPLNTTLTVLALAIIYIVFVPMVRWLIIDAYWIGTDPDACPVKTAACWPFIWARFDQLMYGLYPADQRWRINAGVTVGVL
ncbi:MAG: amino acid ABC transporter permease, partial [Pseudomonadales bacterium]